MSNQSGKKEDKKKKLISLFIKHHSLSPLSYRIETEDQKLRTLSNSQNL